MTFVEAIEALNTFGSLQQGWDSYQGKPISPMSVDWAKVLLARLGDGWTPVPCSDGSVQLEFHEQGVDIEIQVHESSEKRNQEKP